MNFIRNIWRVGFRDAFFWEYTTVDGGLITTNRLKAHIRALDRSMGRCLMLGLAPRYSELLTQRIRLAQMLGKFDSRSTIA